jgi:F0F1-type ATP synthase assembly protein I
MVEQSPKRRGGDQDENWGRYLGIGLEVALGAGLGYLVGGWLDRKYGWHGNGMLVGVMIGVAAGMYLLIREAVRMNKD